MRQRNSNSFKFTRTVSIEGNDFDPTLHIAEIGPGTFQAHITWGDDNPSLREKFSYNDGLTKALKKQGIDVDLGIMDSQLNFTSSTGNALSADRMTEAMNSLGYRHVPIETVGVDMLTRGNEAKLKARFESIIADDPESYVSDNTLNKLVAYAISMSREKIYVGRLRKR
jgi:hypothetical protein